MRLFTSAHIPRYLVDNISHKDFETKDYFKWVDQRLLIPSEKGPTLNPLTHLWALVDPDNLVRGFLHFFVEDLSKNILINQYSVDPNFWGNKGAVPKLIEHMLKIKKEAKLNKILWATRAPKHSKKYGFKPSKNVLMEFQEEE